MLPTGCKVCITAWTKAVVASWVVLVEVAAVGAKGVPVKVGLADKTTLVVPVDAVTPVPPFATGNVPVTPVVIGNPVQLVRTPAEGVPMFGVVNAGLVDRTLFPEPVELVTPVPPLATGKVPVTPVVIGKPVQLVKTPAEGVPMLGVVNAGLVDKTLLPEPVLVVTPVPPLATGSVPVTPVVTGKPVQFVSTPADGVPMFGVVNAGLVDRTLFPEPVEVVTPVPPLATGRVPVTPVVIGNPVQLVKTPADGVPMLGVVNIGVVNVGLVDNTMLLVPVTELLSVTPP